MPCGAAQIALRLQASCSRLQAGWRSPARQLAVLLSGFILASSSTNHVLAGADGSQRLTRVDLHAPLIDEASKRFGVPASWIDAVMQRESAGKVRAVSSAGARGLMQITPGTWEELRARWSLGPDPFDPRDNILAGTAYLRELHDRFGSPGFLAAYNAGPARYQAYLGGRPLPAETRAYVAAIAPHIGSGSLPVAAPMPAAAVAAETLPWRHSPLFIKTTIRTSSVEPARSYGDESATAPRTLAHDVATIVPRSKGLFPSSDEW